jgi:hypothetical protein
MIKIYLVSEVEHKYSLKNLSCYVMTVDILVDRYQWFRLHLLTPFSLPDDRGSILLAERAQILCKSLNKQRLFH